MTRDELKALLDAVSALAPGEEVVIIGSQSILGSFGAEELPAAAVMSREIDVFVLHDETEAKTALIDAVLGESSSPRPARSLAGEARRMAHEGSRIRSRPS